MDCTQILQSQSFLEMSTNEVKAPVATLEIGGIYYTIYNTENLIGRDEDCDVVVKNNKISSKHAIIEADDPDAHVLYDIGSTNKTKLGQKNLKPHVRYHINDGDVITFGDVSALYNISKQYPCTPEKATSSSIALSPERSEIGGSQRKIKFENTQQSPTLSLTNIEESALDNADLDMFDEKSCNTNVISQQNKDDHKKCSKNKTDDIYHLRNLNFEDDQIFENIPMKNLLYSKKGDTKNLSNIKVPEKNELQSIYEMCTEEGPGPSSSGSTVIVSTSNSPVKGIGQSSALMTVEVENLIVEESPPSKDGDSDKSKNDYVWEDFPEIASPVGLDTSNPDNLECTRPNKHDSSPDLIKRTTESSSNSQKMSGLNQPSLAVVKENREKLLSAMERDKHQDTLQFSEGLFSDFQKTESHSGKVNELFVSASQNVDMFEKTVQNKNSISNNDTSVFEVLTQSPSSKNEANESIYDMATQEVDNVQLAQRKLDINISDNDTSIYEVLTQSPSCKNEANESIFDIATQEVGNVQLAKIKLDIKSNKDLSDLSSSFLEAATQTTAGKTREPNINFTVTEIDETCREQNPTFYDAATQRFSQGNEDVAKRDKSKVVKRSDDLSESLFETPTQKYISKTNDQSKPQNNDELSSSFFEAATQPILGRNIQKPYSPMKTAVKISETSKPDFKKSESSVIEETDLSSSFFEIATQPVSRNPISEPDKAVMISKDNNKICQDPNATFSADLYEVATQQFIPDPNVVLPSLSPKFGLVKTIAQALIEPTSGIYVCAAQPRPSGLNTERQLIEKSKNDLKNLSLSSNFFEAATQPTNIGLSSSRGKKSYQSSMTNPQADDPYEIQTQLFELNKAKPKSSHLTPFEKRTNIQKPLSTSIADNFYDLATQDPPIYPVQKRNKNVKQVSKQLNVSKTKVKDNIYGIETIFSETPPIKSKPAGGKLPGFSETFFDAATQPYLLKNSPKKLPSVSMSTNFVKQVRKTEDSDIYEALTQGPFLLLEKTSNQNLESCNRDRFQITTPDLRRILSGEPSPPINYDLKVNHPEKTCKPANPNTEITVDTRVASTYKSNTLECHIQKNEVSDLAKTDFAKKDGSGLLKRLENKSEDSILIDLVLSEDDVLFKERPKFIREMEHPISITENVICDSANTDFPNQHRSRSLKRTEKKGEDSISTHYETSEHDILESQKFLRDLENSVSDIKCLPEVEGTRTVHSNPENKDEDLTSTLESSSHKTLKKILSYESEDSLPPVKTQKTVEKLAIDVENENSSQELEFKFKKRGCNVFPSDSPNSAEIPGTSETKNKLKMIRGSDELSQNRNISHDKVSTDDILTPIVGSHQNNVNRVLSDDESEESSLNLKKLAAENENSSEEFTIKFKKRGCNVFPPDTQELNEKTLFSEVKDNEPEGVKLVENKMSTSNIPMTFKEENNTIALKIKGASDLDVSIVEPPLCPKNSNEFIVDGARFTEVEKSNSIEIADANTENASEKLNLDTGLNLLTGKKGPSDANETLSDLPLISQVETNCKATESKENNSSDGQNIEYMSRGNITHLTSEVLSNMEQECIQATVSVSPNQISMPFCQELNLQSSELPNRPATGRRSKRHQKTDTVCKEHLFVDKADIESSLVLEQDIKSAEGRVSPKPNDNFPRTRKCKKVLSQPELCEDRKSPKPNKSSQKTNSEDSEFTNLPVTSNKRSKKVLSKLERDFKLATVTENKSPTKASMTSEDIEEIDTHNSELAKSREILSKLEEEFKLFAGRMSPTQLSTVDSVSSENEEPLRVKGIERTPTSVEKSASSPLSRTGKSVKKFKKATPFKTNKKSESLPEKSDNRKGVPDKIYKEVSLEENILENSQNLDDSQNSELGRGKRKRVRPSYEGFILEDDMKPFRIKRSSHVQLDVSEISQGTCKKDEQSTLTEIPKDVSGPVSIANMEIGTSKKDKQSTLTEKPEEVSGPVSFANLDKRISIVLHDVRKTTIQKGETSRIKNKIEDQTDDDLLPPPSKNIDRVTKTSEKAVKRSNSSLTETTFTDKLDELFNLWGPADRVKMARRGVNKTLKESSLVETERKSIPQKLNKKINSPTPSAKSEKSNKPATSSKDKKSDEKVIHNNFKITQKSDSDLEEKIISRGKRSAELKVEAMKKNSFEVPVKRKKTYLETSDSANLIESDVAPGRRSTRLTQSAPVKQVGEIIKTEIHNNLSNVEVPVKRKTIYSETSDSADVSSERRSTRHSQSPPVKQVGKIKKTHIQNNSKKVEVSVKRKKTYSESSDSVYSIESDCAPERRLTRLSQSTPVNQIGEIQKTEIQNSLTKVGVLLKRKTKYSETSTSPYVSSVRRSTRLTQSPPVKQVEKIMKTNIQNNSKKVVVSVKRNKTYSESSDSANSIGSDATPERRLTRHSQSTPEKQVGESNKKKIQNTSLKRVAEPSAKNATSKEKVNKALDVKVTSVKTKSSQENSSTTSSVPCNTRPKIDAAQSTNYMSESFIMSQEFRIQEKSVNKSDNANTFKGPELKIRRSSRKKINEKTTNREPERVMFTGYSDKKMVALVQKLGGQIVEKPFTCTVLVTDKVRRTAKFLCALSRGLPIVSPDWLNQCKETKAFADANQFLLKDEEAETTYNFSLNVSINKAKLKKLLDGWSVFVTSSVKPPPHEMKDIIECSGGRFLSKEQNRWNTNAIIVSCEEDRTKWAGLERQGKMPVIVATEAIFSGILRQNLDLESHRLF